MLNIEVTDDLNIFVTLLRLHLSIQFKNVITGEFLRDKEPKLVNTRRIPDLQNSIVKQGCILISEWQ